MRLGAETMRSTDRLARRVARIRFADVSTDQRSACQPSIWHSEMGMAKERGHRLL